jgi:hypothetical protein
MRWRACNQACLKKEALRPVSPGFPQLVRRKERIVFPDYIA